MPTLAELRARVETDLDDATLQTILEAETEFLTRNCGADTETETQLAGGLRSITLNRKPSSITSVTERTSFDADPVTLNTNDWRQVGKYSLRRLATGNNPSSFWGAEVVIAYAPDLDLQLRERVLMDLVQISVEFRAMETETVGDYERSETQGAYEKRRAALVAQVSEGRGIFL